MFSWLFQFLYFLILVYFLFHFSLFGFLLLCRDFYLIAFFFSFRDLFHRLLSFISSFVICPHLFYRFYPPFPYSHFEYFLNLHFYCLLPLSHLIDLQSSPIIFLYSYSLSACLPLSFLYFSNIFPLFISLYLPLLILSPLFSLSLVSHSSPPFFRYLPLPLLALLSFFIYFLSLPFISLFSSPFSSPLSVPECQSVVHQRLSNDGTGDSDSDNEAVS